MEHDHFQPDVIFPNIVIKRSLLIAISTLQSKFSVIIQLPSFYILQTIYALDHDTAMIKTSNFGVRFYFTITVKNVRMMQRVMANSRVCLCIMSLLYCSHNISSSFFALFYNDTFVFGARSGELCSLTFSPRYGQLISWKYLFD